MAKLTNILNYLLLGLIAVFLSSSFIWHDSEGKKETRQLQLRVDEQCKDIEPQENFNFEAYVKAPWFVQKQRVISYLPEDRFFCTEARYGLDPDLFPALFGWDVTVNNYDEDVNGNGRGGDGLCAAIVDKKMPSKLGVSPCALVPSFFWARIGPYWVMDFDDDAGWAVISGGRPSIWTGSGCKARDDAGTWIFTRVQTGEAAANATLLALDAAREKGMDVDNLDDFLIVNQSSCNRED